MYVARLPLPPGSEGSEGDELVFRHTERRKDGKTDGQKGVNFEIAI